jgi:hypothetical protein
MDGSPNDLVGWTYLHLAGITCHSRNFDYLSLCGCILPTDILTPDGYVATWLSKQEVHLSLRDFGATVADLEAFQHGSSLESVSISDSFDLTSSIGLEWAPTAEVRHYGSQSTTCAWKSPRYFVTDDDIEVGTIEEFPLYGGRSAEISGYEKTPCDKEPS